MKNNLLRQLVLITGLMLVNFQIKAETAIATVSANVVPVSQLAMSGGIVLNNKAGAYQGKGQLKADGYNIELTSFNGKNSAKLKVDSSNNTAYDISISPSLTVTNSLSSKKIITNMRVNNNNEQELEIEATIIDHNARDTGIYFGTVEINVNYN